MLLAACPFNKNHKTFATVASIQQVWIVDENGNFEESLEDCSDVLHYPNAGNSWTCQTCGTEAEVQQT